MDIRALITAVLLFLAFAASGHVQAANSEPQFVNVWTLITIRTGYDGIRILGHFKTETDCKDTIRELSSNGASRSIYTVCIKTNNLLINK